MIEQSLVLVKPDAVIDNHTDEIRRFLQEKGMILVIEASIRLDRRRLREFYPCVISLESFEKMVVTFAKCDSIVLTFRGENAIRVGREAKKYFREKYDYGYYGSTIHASDDREGFERELSLLSHYSQKNLLLAKNNVA